MRATLHAFNRQTLRSRRSSVFPNRVGILQLLRRQSRIGKSIQAHAHQLAALFKAERGEPLAALEGHLPDVPDAPRNDHFHEPAVLEALLANRLQAVVQQHAREAVAPGKGLVLQRHQPVCRAKVRAP